MAAITSSISKFQNPGKEDLANICQIICRKFHQNPLIRMGCSASTHTQIDRQTHTHTHTSTIGSTVTYSVKMTEYENACFMEYWIKTYHTKSIKGLVFVNKLRAQTLF